MKRRFSIATVVYHDGETLSVSEWLERYGITRSRAWRRFVALGWSLEDAVTTPPRIGSGPRIPANSRLVEFGGRVMSVSAWGRELGISYPSVIKRLTRYPVEIALTRPKCNNTFCRVDGTRQTPPNHTPTFMPEELHPSVSLKVANQRIRHGWTREEAASVPVVRFGQGDRWGRSRGNMNRLRDLAALGIVI